VPSNRRARTLPGFWALGGRRGSVASWVLARHGAVLMSRLPPGLWPMAPFPSFFSASPKVPCPNKDGMGIPQRR